MFSNELNEFNCHPQSFVRWVVIYCDYTGFCSTFMKTWSQIMTYSQCSIHEFNSDGLNMINFCY